MIWRDLGRQIMNNIKIFNMKEGVESFFIKANHLTDDRAFWLKFTFLKRKNEKPTFCINAILLNGNDVWTGSQTFKNIEEVYFPYCKGVTWSLGQVHFGLCGISKGSIETNMGHCVWDLGWNDFGIDQSVKLLPEFLYSHISSVTKIITPRPQIGVCGTIMLNGAPFLSANDEWVGMQGHSWGKKYFKNHTWMQTSLINSANSLDLIVEGFTTVTGPFNFTSFNIRTPKKEYKFSDILSFYRFNTVRDGNIWRVSCENKTSSMDLYMEMPKNHAILECENPNGTFGKCHSSNISYMNLVIDDQKYGRDEFNSSSAALEFLED